MIHVRLQKDTCHVGDHLFILCTITRPKQHFIKNSPSSPRKNCLEPWTPSYHHLLCHWKNTEKNPEKPYHISFCSEAICWSVKPRSICITYLYHFSHREPPCLKTKLISPLCLILPTAYTLLTLHQVQLALPSNMYWLSKWHLTLFARKRLPEYKVWGQSGQEEWARITHSLVRPYLVKSWKRQYFCCIQDTIIALRCELR